MTSPPAEPEKEDEGHQGISPGQDFTGLEASPENVSTVPGGIILGVDQTHFSGPLPHPEIMAGYEHTLTGSAERILKMTEEAQRHRHAMEKTSLQGAIRFDFLGWASSTVITILVLVGSFSLINQGQSVFGVAGVIAAAAVLVATFLRSRQERFTTRDGRREQDT
ncbi:MAG: DUF2335 domain-containing protein [Anaerolineaceae bacterium]|nr:DUF2335 domain-containing protein [Anaerolineaceae bacterium]